VVVAFKEIFKDDRPRERLLKHGVKALSNEELVAILLKTGTKSVDVMTLARLILSKISTMQDLEDLSLSDLTRIHGIGTVKAMELLASIELGKRLNVSRIENRKKMNHPKRIFDEMSSLFEHKSQEQFYALYLDHKKNLIEKKLLFVGTVNMSVVHPREIFKYAYLNSASFIICVHNHPSGDPTPSIQDVAITENLYQVGNLQQIYVIDHIIIGNTYYSFYENGKVIK